MMVLHNSRPSLEKKCQGWLEWRNERRQGSCSSKREVERRVEKLVGDDDHMCTSSPTKSIRQTASRPWKGRATRDLFNTARRDKDEINWEQRR